MITLNAQDKTKLEAALARAEAAELKLTVLYQSTVGAHYVVDSDHSRHQVYIWLEGDRAAYECDCTAHVERSLICRCAAAALKDFQEKLEAAKVAPAQTDYEKECALRDQALREYSVEKLKAMKTTLLRQESWCEDDYEYGMALDRIIKEKTDLGPLPEGPKCQSCGRDAFAYTMGEWTCIECATQDQAQEICNQEQMPEIDFDANPNEQQCQNCLRLWVNDTEFAYKVCPDCRSKSRWAHWDEVEAAEALNPEPEHTRYEESIASANYSQIEAATEAPALVEPLECIKPGCHAAVEGHEAYCFDHQLEMAATYSDLFGD